MQAVAKNSSGQTLVEIVIAIGLVAFVLVGLVAGTTVSLRSARLSHERNIANQLATSALEQERQSRDEDPDAYFTADSMTTTASDTTPVFTTLVTKTLNGDQALVVAEVSWVDAEITFHALQSTVLYRLR